MAKCLIDGGKIKCSMGDGGAKPIKVIPKNMAKAKGNPALVKGGPSLKVSL